jgi:hypothetical protein
VKSLVAGIAVLAIVSAVVFFARGAPRKSTEQPPADRVEAHEGVSAPPESRDELAPRSAREATEPTKATPASAAPAPEHAPPPDPADLVVRARLVDERGMPVVTGRLSVQVGKENHAAESTQDGEAALAFSRDALKVQNRWIFEASAPGRIRRTSEVEQSLLEGKESYYLGELVLLPGGILVGRVVDERGSPASGASVIARPPSTEDKAWERVFLPWSWFGDGIRVSAICSDDGGYRLEGVPCGSAEVLASDRKHLVARSDVLEVRAATETRVPDLVVRTPADADRIAGRVTHAGGRPFPGVHIALMSADENVGYPSGAPSDADGRFELVAVRDVVYTLLARDPATRREARRKVSTGQLGIELVFEDGRSLELAVRDAKGPVAGFRVVVENAKHRGLSGQASTEPGIARIANLPSETFFLNVISLAHEPVRLGPFEPSSAPAKLEAVLERAGGVSGIVLAGGKPVPLAEVHAHIPLREGTFGLTPENFVSFVEPFLVSETRAGEDGRFFLPLRMEGRYLLHAAVAGGARGASEWLAFALGTQVEGLELRLPEAGAIAGRLLVAAGVDPRGVWIGAGDGDGHVELAQTGEDGGFRFAGLAPGRWQVHRIRPGQERNVIRNRTCWPAEDDAEPPAWDVELRAGATASFDIDVRDEVPCTLDGRLAFNGQGAGGFTAYMDSGTSALLDAEGRFTLKVPKAGRFQLSLLRERTQLYVAIQLEAGPNAWELDLPAGEVHLENLPSVPRDPRQGRSEDWPEYALFWSRGGLSWSTFLQENPSASARLADVPAGALVLRFRGEGAHPQDEENWPVLSEIDLEAAGVVTLRLP